MAQVTCRFASQPKWNGWSARKVTCHAGFGGKSRRQDSQGQRVSRKVDLARELEIRTVKSEEKKFVGRGAPTGPEWVRACNLTDLNSKPPMGRKACILDSTKILIVRASEEEVFACAAEGTAFSFPLVDGNVDSDPDTGRWRIASPLDGSVYDLKSGKVLRWCPQDTWQRKVLGRMNETGRVERKDLRVYPNVVTTDGDIYVKMRIGT